MRQITHLILFLLTFSLLFLIAQGQQERQAQEEQTQEKPIATGLTEKVDVHLVLLEAVVHDKRRSHIRGLNKEDFQLLESGKEQEIAVFEEIDLRRTETFEEAIEKEGAEILIEEDSKKVPPTERKGRTILFLFDVYNNPSALYINQAKKAVRDFMETRFKPNDLAAVFELTPELSMACKFTSDWSEVIHSLEKIRFFPGKSMGEEMVAGAANFKIPYKEEFSQRMAYTTALRNQIFRQERENYYYNLRSLAFTLSELPGKRMIILFSGGFPMTIPGDINDYFGGISPAFRDLITDMGKQRITFYTFDTGEMTALPDASKGVDYRLVLDKLGFGEDFFENIGLGSSFFQDSMMARRQILAVLGNETGGSFMINPDYKAGLASIDDDTNHYYLLGYYPSEKVKKDQYKKIKIKVAKKGVTVLSRKGRFATKEEKKKPRDYSPETTFRNVKKLQIEAKESKDIIVPSEIATMFSPGENGKTRVNLAIQVFDNVEPFINEQGNGVVDMTLKIDANAGEITVDSVEKDIKALLKPEGIQALSEGFRLLEYIDLVPAIYDFQVFLKMNGVGKYTFWSKTLEIPGFKEEVLELSSFSLAMIQASPLIFDSYSNQEKVKEESNESAGPNSPFELRNGMKIIPVAARTFQKEDTIFIFYKILNAKIAEDSGKIDLDMRFQFLSAQDSGELKIQPNLLYFEPGKDGKSYDALVELKIPDYKPGFYKIRAAITDKKAGKTVNREESIQLL